MSWLIAPFWNLRESRLRAGWRLLMQFLLFFFVLILYAIAVAGTLGLTQLDESFLSEEVVMGVVQSAAMMVSVVFAAMWLDRRHSEDFGVGPNWWFELGIGLLLGIVAMVGIFFIEYSLDWVRVVRFGPDESLSLTKLLSRQIGWLLVMIGVGFGEEFVSRGYHLKNLAEGFRFLGRTGAVCLAILISSLVFGLLHMGNDNASWISTLGIVMAGIMLAAGRLVTGSLATPIGLHISWNYVQGPLLGFPVSGNLTDGSLLALEQGGDPLWSGGEFGPEAGLVGLLAEICLLLVFVVWGVRRGKLKRYVARLCRYQPADRNASKSRPKIALTQQMALAQGNSPSPFGPDEKSTDPLEPPQHGQV